MSLWKLLTGTASAIYIAKTVRAHDEAADEAFRAQLESESGAASIARWAVSIGTAIGAYGLASGWFVEAWVMPLLVRLFIALFAWYAGMRHPKTVVVLSLIAVGVCYLVVFAVHAGDAR